MSEYRFHLQKYRYGSKISCPNCGRSRCFVRYVDEESIIRFPDTVGKCDHENSCGYHYTPREYFRVNPDVLSQPDGGRADRRILPMAAERETPHPVPSFISADVVMRSLSHYEINPLYHYLCQTFGEEETQRLFRLYRIGTSSKWGGATIFWQTDRQGQVRTGKIMLYDPATGGKNGSFNREAMSVLRDREVTLIPDLGATERWREKSALLADICKRVVVSDMLERLATDEQRSQGLDIADFFLTVPTQRQILQQMIRRNPALQLLIDELDLELIE